MRARKIYESPDIISLPDLKYNSYGESMDPNMWSPEMGDDDSHPFWLSDGAFVLGKAIDAHPPNIRYDDNTLAGRVWKERKMISFWTYPDKRMFFNMIEGLSAHLGRYYNEEINILDDPEWKVEILPEDKKAWRGLTYVKEKDPETFQASLIPVKDYQGSGQRSPIDLAQEHGKTPMDPTKKGPDRYNKRKTVWDRIGESKLVPESLNEAMKFQRGKDPKEAMGIGIEAAKERIKKEIGWRLESPDWAGSSAAPNLYFSSYDLRDFWASATEFDKSALKAIMIELLSGLKKWRTGNFDHHVISILNDLELLWQTEYMVPTPATAESIRYAGLDGPEFHDFVDKHWKPNQIYALGVNTADPELMKAGIKKGATNLDIGGTGVFEVPLGNDDGELLQLLLDKSEVDPGEMFQTYQGSSHGYGRGKRKYRDESNRALRFAARDGKINTFKILFNDKRSDPSATNNFALKHATKGEYWDIVNMLLKDERVQSKLDLLPSNVKNQLRVRDLMESVDFKRGQDPKDAMGIGYNANVLKFIDWVERDFQFDKSHPDYFGYINIGYAVEWDDGEERAFKDKDLEDGYRKFVKDWKRFLPLLAEKNRYLTSPPHYDETIISDERILGETPILEAVNFERGKEPGEAMGIGKHSKDLKVYACGNCGAPTDEWGEEIPYDSDEFKRVTGIMDDMNHQTTEKVTCNTCYHDMEREETRRQEEYEAEEQQEWEDEQERRESGS